jgi:hypothetical protein
MPRPAQRPYPFPSSRLSAGLLLILVLVSRPLHGQDLDDPARIDLAKVYMEEAQGHFLAGRYNEAAITFMKAYSVVPFSAFLFNTAVAYEKIKMFKHAAEFFERYLDAEPEAADRDEILARIADLQERAEKEGIEEPPIPPPEVLIEKVECGVEGQPPCEETSPPPAGTSLSAEMKSLINIRTNPSNATITITAYPDVEVATGTGPMVRTMEQGKYKITVEHPKHKTVDTMVDISGGRIYVVVVEMSQGAFLGYLNVRTSRPGAEVFLDDKSAGSVGKTPIGFPLPKGKHVLWLELPGYEPVQQEVDVLLGEETTVKVELERVAYGVLAVKTNVDGSQIILDKNKEKKTLAPLSVELPPGSHHVQVKAKGMKPVKQNVAVEKGMQTTLLVRLNPKPKKTYAWISFGLMAAFLTAGGVLAHYAGSLHDDLEMDRKLGYQESGDGRINKGLGLSIGADVAFLFGGIMCALGIYYLVRDKLPDSETSLKGPQDLADLEEEK